ncbi:carboxymuconolactone decarboxylase family protein [Streptomyces bacillaris]
MRRALANGLTADELAEAITHLAFYAGWPAAMSAVGVLASVTAETASQE